MNLDKHHAIRCAVRGLVGKDREAAILRLLKNPEKIPWMMGNINPKKRLGYLKRGKPVGRRRLLRVDVTAAQYKLLRAESVATRISMASLVRSRLFSKQVPTLKGRTPKPKTIEAWMQRSS